MSDRRHFYFGLTFIIILGFPGGSDGKESACNAGDMGLIPGLGRSPGEGNGYPLHYSCPKNSMERRAWQAIQSMGSQRVGHDCYFKRVFEVNVHEYLPAFTQFNKM